MDMRKNSELNLLQIGIYAVVLFCILNGAIWGLLTWNAQKGWDLYSKEIDFVLFKPFELVVDSSLEPAAHSTPDNQQ